MSSTDIQLYTEDGSYSAWQIGELNKKLDPRLVSTRKGGSGMLKYIEGHDAIDQANRIFGYGNWGYKPVSLEQVVLIDPLTGEAVGIEYKAEVELTVRGAITSIIDVGSQPVATWNVEDQVMGRRVNDAKYNKKPVDESPFTPLERKNARAVIVEAHEQAKKGAVTDALKRALRAYGEQFGNGLYGDGRVDFSFSEGATVDAKPQQQHTAPRQLQPALTPLEKALEGHKSRALFLGVISKDEEFLPWLAKQGITEVKTGADLAKVNGALITIERQKKAS